MFFVSNLHIELDRYPELEQHEGNRDVRQHNSRGKKRQNIIDKRRPSTGLKQRPHVPSNLIQYSVISIQCWTTSPFLCELSAYVRVTIKSADLTCKLHTASQPAYSLDCNTALHLLFHRLMSKLAKWLPPIILSVLGS